MYDERGRGRGYYKWNETRELFDAEAVEACGSSILNIVRDYQVTFNLKLLGDEIVKYICENITNEWVDDLLGELLQEIAEGEDNTNVNYYRQEILEHLLNCKEAIDSIENEIIYLLAQHSLSITVELLRDISNNLLENTLAYYLATEAEKNLLRQLFNAIGAKVEEQIGNVQRYTGIMLPMADANQIIEWIADNAINTEKRTAKELLEPIEDLFDRIYPSLALKKGFALSWIRGDSYEKISKDYDISVYDVEKYCQYNLSYQMSFLVGNVIDLVDAECENIDALMLLQQTLRYGVNTKTAVSICEKVFNDRFLAKKMTTVIGNNGVSNDEIGAFVKAKKEAMISLLDRYPSYFANVVENI